MVCSLSFSPSLSLSTKNSSLLKCVVCNLSYLECIYSEEMKWFVEWCLNTFLAAENVAVTEESSSIKSVHTGLVIHGCRFLVIKKKTIIIMRGNGGRVLYC